MRMRREWRILAAGVLLMAGIGCRTTDEKPSAQSDSSVRPRRIVCFGDSLTVCGGAGGRYTDYLARWLPDDEVINKGVSGDTLAGGRARYARDVLALSPDVVVVELGANDFWKAVRPLDDLAADLEFLVRSARQAGAQVVIASCFGDVAFGDASPEFQEDKRTSYAAGIARFEKGIAARYGALYVPNMQADIKPLAEKKQYWSDNNHPNKAGNEFVAKRILVELQKALQREKSPPGPIPLRRGCSSHQTPTATRLPRTGGSV